MKTSLRGLYLVTPDWDDTALLLSVTQAAILGGAACVQYRHKGASAALRKAQALGLAHLCRQHNVPVIINDDIDLALEVHADGVHIGRDDVGIGDARRRVGNAMLVGVSCYDDFTRAEQAAGAGADYVAFGAMYSSPTKPHAVAAPIELVSRAKHELGVTVACIGGITYDNASELVRAGADMLAVITDIYKAQDPKGRAAQFRKLFSSF